MSKQVAIVTGANRGLGLEVSRQLAGAGFHVIMTGRSAEKIAAAAAELRTRGLEVEADTVDVTSDQQVEAFAARFRARHDRLDVLVNNAGAILDGTHDRDREAEVSPFVVPTEVVLRSVDLNALGAYRMTAALLPLMNAAGHGRVVHVSSGMGALGDMGGGWPAYRLSKTALSAVTRIFHAVAANDVKVNAVCPGWVRTDMGGPRATRSLAEGAAGIVLAATLPADGPSGAFLRDGRPIPW
jgi:NAD(P)-dependent dehydrogenase (short-subunit alcohol dehydrogenase family)